MCGIAGAIGARADRGVGLAMAAAMRHRGPDGEGIFVDDGIMLSHRRLAVVDTSTENAQPFISGDGRFVLVYNGEIYNFRELRRELEQRGSRFRTTGDTEVVLEAYRHWGDRCAEHFTGMFAFACWDREQRELVLARDRLGEKPLYLWNSVHAFVFASELPALLAHPEVPRQLSATGLSDYLTLNFTLGQRGILQGIWRLPPATIARVTDSAHVSTRRYWDLAESYRRKTSLTFPEAADRLASMIDESVQARLVSDVPLGAFLSGGIDSTTVVSSASRVTSGLRTFTARLEDPSFDEGTTASLAARELGVRSTECMVTPSAAELESILSGAGEPLADTALPAFFAVARCARESVTVSLSGDGSDEIFGGYVTYAADAVRNAVGRPGLSLLRAVARMTQPRKADWSMMNWRFLLEQFAAGASHPAAGAHLRWRGIFDDASRARVLRPRAHAGEPLDDYLESLLAPVRECSLLDRMMYLDAQTWLPDNILTVTDRMSMAHGLELRAPLLDHYIVEFAASLPTVFKRSIREGKRVLRASQAGRMPETPRRRRKRGLNVPLARWVAGPWHDLLRDATQSAAMREVVNVDEVNRMWMEHLARRRDHGLRLFGLGSLALWVNSVRPTIAG